MLCADGGGYSTAVAQAMATAFTSGNGQAMAKATATAIATYGCPAVQTVIARECPRPRCMHPVGVGVFATNKASVRKVPGM